jgi:hypothetical protein
MIWTLIEIIGQIVSLTLASKKKIYADGLAVGIDFADGGRRHSSTMIINEYLKKYVPTARPSAQLCLCRRQLCADGDLTCLPYHRVLPTAPINCRRHGPLFLSRSA